MVESGNNDAPGLMVLGDPFLIGFFLFIWEINEEMNCETDNAFMKHQIMIFWFQNVCRHMCLKLKLCQLFIPKFSVLLDCDDRAHGLEVTASGKSCDRQVPLPWVTDFSNFFRPGLLEWTYVKKTSVDGQTISTVER